MDPVSSHRFSSSEDTCDPFRWWPWRELWVMNDDIIDVRSG